MLLSFAPRAVLDPIEPKCAHVADLNTHTAALSKCRDCRDGLQPIWAAWLHGCPYVSDHGHATRLSWTLSSRLCTVHDDSAAINAAHDGNVFASPCHAQRSTASTWVAITALTELPREPASANRRLLSTTTRSKSNRHVAESSWMAAILRCKGPG